MSRSQRAKAIEEARRQINRRAAEREDDPAPFALPSTSSGRRPNLDGPDTPVEDTKALLRRVNDRLRQDLVNIDMFPTLAFVDPPRKDSRPLPPLVNPAAYALDPLSPENNHAFTLTRELNEYKSILLRIRAAGDDVKRQRADALALLNDMSAKFDIFRRREWEKQRQMAMYPFAAPGMISSSSVQYIA
ncbi:hypothetical protein K523DRAFT_359080 [Schizophyllum commune Tattone D]|nr:hypothetical protein K523DRAFT_359080 [Schizophyllum commune Tattone D]